MAASVWTLIVTDGRPACFQEHRIPQPHLDQPASLLEVAGFPFLVHARPSPESSFLNSAFSYTLPTEAGAPQRPKLMCVLNSSQHYR